MAGNPSVPIPPERSAHLLPPFLKYCEHSSHDQDNNRLRALVEHAHKHGLWIRFYTLDGASKKQLSRNGWFPFYNFGSLQAAEIRWRAALDAGVDYIASDQYETLGAFLKQNEPGLSRVKGGR